MCKAFEDMPKNLWLRHFQNHCFVNLDNNHPQDEAALQEEWEIFVQIHQDDGYWSLKTQCPFSLEDVASS